MGSYLSWKVGRISIVAKHLLCFMFICFLVIFVDLARRSPIPLSFLDFLRQIGIRAHGDFHGLMAGFGRRSRRVGVEEHDAQVLWMSVTDFGQQPSRWDELNLMEDKQHSRVLFAQNRDSKVGSRDRRRSNLGVAPIAPVRTRNQQNIQRCKAMFTRVEPWLGLENFENHGRYGISNETDLEIRNWSYEAKQSLIESSTYEHCWTRTGKSRDVQCGWKSDYYNGRNGFCGLRELEISNFEGNLDIEEFLDWLAAVEEFFDCMDIPEEKQVRYVVHKLRGGAADWWQQVLHKRLLEGREPIRSWPKMKRLLKGKFLPSTYFQTMYHRFLNCKQLSRSVDKYTDEFYYLCAENNIQESDELVLRYMYGLNVAIRERLEFGNVWTMNEVINLALNVESHRARKIGKIKTTSLSNFCQNDANSLNSISLNSGHKCTPFTSHVMDIAGNNFREVDKQTSVDCPLSSLPMGISHSLNDWKHGCSELSDNIEEEENCPESNFVGVKEVERERTNEGGIDQILRCEQVKQDVVLVARNIVEKNNLKLNRIVATDEHHETKAKTETVESEMELKSVEIELVTTFINPDQSEIEEGVKATNFKGAGLIICKDTKELEKELPLISTSCNLEGFHVIVDGRVINQMDITNPDSRCSLLGGYFRKAEFDTVELLLRNTQIEFYSFGTVLHMSVGLSIVQFGNEVHCQYLKICSRGNDVVQTALLDFTCSSNLGICLKVIERKIAWEMGLEQIFSWHDCWLWKYSLAESSLPM